MARFLAQLLSPVFLLLGLGGLFLGDAGTAGKGELGPLDLDLTWARDILDIALLLALVLVGFVLARHAGRLTMATVGVVLVVFGVLGFVAGEGGVLGLRGGLPMNLFDFAAGALALLAAAGTIEEPEPPQGSFLRGR
jgi:lipopolysaccharide export LptBFGC system permease protein LptF